ncbi:hypothetical protein NXU92_22380 [Bacteroides fragilis]|nr:hypothetical protein [Bacteroides fragilis]
MDLEYTSKEEGKRSIDSSHSRQRIMSVLSTQVNYDYQTSTHSFGFETRRTGNQLSKRTTSGSVPGVSAGWVFSK